MTRAFEWDERKAAINLAAHHISFREATAVFLDPLAIEFDVSRAEDGEARCKSIGMIEGRLFTVVFTRRGETTRLISARRANRKEERSYGNRSLYD